MKKKQKVIFCTPTRDKPSAPFISALEACVHAVEEAGFEHGTVSTVANPYISNARNEMLRKALDARADMIVFLDDDVSWRPEDMVKLLTAEGEVVAGTYRFKKDEEEYMGMLEVGESGRPLVREDGAIKAHRAPAGFLRVTRHAVNEFMQAYPELVFGDYCNPSVDLFNHGVVFGDRLWWGEDYAFSRRWNEKCGQLWILPDLNIDHHGKDKVFKGNLHRYLLEGGKQCASSM